MFKQSRNSLATYSVMVCMLGFVPSLVHAQNARLAVPLEAFAEGYTGQANVSSGGVLVGLTIGDETRWSGDHVAVTLPSLQTSRLCLRTSSLDGRFWSENPFLPPKDTLSANLGPISKNYAKIVNTLLRRELSFRVAIPTSGRCDDLTSAQYLPVLAEGKNELVVTINSGGRKVASRLTRKGKVLTDLTWCDTIAQSAGVAADRICRIALGEITGPAELQLALIGMTGRSEKMNFDIYVPIH